MPLKFECNRDPRTMKSVNGKKFCEVCRKNVYDVRRKSIEKIVQLKKAKGECCVFIYEDQLAKAESILSQENNFKRQPASFLPYAAGIAAMNLLPQLDYSQQPFTPGPNQPETVMRDEAGQIIHGKKTEKTGNTLYKFGGRIKKLSKFKKLNLEIGYNDSNAVFHPVKEIVTKIGGKFSFQLTKEQLEVLKKNEIHFHSKHQWVKIEEINLEDNTKDIVLYIWFPRTLGGKF